MTNQTKPCRNCQMPIPKSASACCHCHRSQNYFLSKLEYAAPLVTVLSLVLSIILVYVSYRHLSEATKQRESANWAFKFAHDASEQAVSAKESARKADEGAKVARADAVDAKNEALFAVEYLRTNIKYLMEKEHLDWKVKLPGSDRKRLEEVVQKLEKFAVPNEEERKQWLKSLK